MGLVKKLKDILFEEEEEFEEPIKIADEPKKEEPKIVKLEPLNEEKQKEEIKKENTSERELFRSENSFQFPDFDEEEFASSVSSVKTRANVLDYERKKVSESKNDYNRYERSEPKDVIDKKKFKPSPIISPVYGILNQDYRAEDIVNKSDVASNIDIDAVRKKAFENEPKIEKDIIDEPVVTFFEEKESTPVKEEKVVEEVKEDFKSIDDLIEDAADEISLEDTIEIPKTNNIDAIEDELEKLDFEEKDTHKELDDTKENDLFELIDSMYDDREED